MELINNTTKTLRDDLSVEIKEGSKLSIAAACFSIYAFQELKKQLSNIDELRFILDLKLTFFLIHSAHSFAIPSCCFYDIGFHVSKRTASSPTVRILTL